MKNYIKTLAKLTFYFSKRELINRGAGSVIGIGWAFIQPMVMVIIYIFIFSIILKIKVGSKTHPTSFALFLLAGFIPWAQFQETLIRSSTIILENRDAVKKIAFPVESTVSGVLLSIHTMYSVPFAIFTLYCLTKLPNTTVSTAYLLFQLLTIYLLQGIFCLGLSLMLASLTVYVRDIPQALFPTLQVWFYLTPIVYPLRMVPSKFQWIIKLNPWTYLVEGYRSSLLYGSKIELQSTLIHATIFAIILISGLMVFEKLKEGFPDVL